MPSIISGDDSPIRVVVTPSQSSYFAGETFAVTVTFTNTRSTSYTLGDPGPSRTHAYTHKRGAHSISSAPLARPPTSPGTPRSAITPAPPRPKPTPDELPRRKGIIGKAKAKTTPVLPNGSDPLPELLEQRRRRQLAHKSLSVSISPYELEDQLSKSPGSPKVLLYDSRTPTTPHIPSPLARTDTLPLAASHPHARKQSILDGQFSLDMLSPTTSTPPLPSSHPLSISTSYNTHSSHPYASNIPSSLGAPYSPTSSTSTFSLVLDPISEASAAAAALASPYASSLAIGQPSIETPAKSPMFQPTTGIASSENGIVGVGNGNGNTHASISQDGNGNGYAYLPRHQHRPSPIGLGQPSSTPRGYGTAPNTPNLNNHPYNQNSPHTPYTPKTPTMPSSNPITSNHYISPPQHPHRYPKTAFTSSFPSQTSSHELLLYAYAQLTGTLQLVPVAGVLPTKDQSNTLNWVRKELVSSERGVVGGGRMGIGIGMGMADNDVPDSAGALMGGGRTPSSAVRMSPSGRSRHTRGVSLSAAVGGVWSILSPSALVSTLAGPATPTSAAPGAGGVGPGSARISSSSWRDSSNTSVLPLSTSSLPDVDPEQPLPTFEVQPAMLAVDLMLGPGESRSYTYSIKLPSVLPPTFKGKSLRFSYEFVVGTCRAGTSVSPMGASAPTQGSSASISRVMKVPIRVYNHVSVERPQGPYDLLWPSVQRQRARDRRGYNDQDAKAKVVEVVKESEEVGSVLSARTARSVSSPATQAAPSYTHESIKEYAEALLRASAAVVEAQAREEEEERAREQEQKKEESDELEVDTLQRSSSSSTSISTSSSASSSSTNTTTTSPSSSPRQSTSTHPSSVHASLSSSKTSDLPLGEITTDEFGKADGYGPKPSESDDTITKARLNGYMKRSKMGEAGEGVAVDAQERRVREWQKDEGGDQLSPLKSSPSISRSTSGSGAGVGVNGSGNGNGLELSVDGVNNVRQDKVRPEPLDLRRMSSEGERNKEREKERVDEGGLTGCREAVELLTRNPKKATYDVNKDGVRVALLTFPKSAYRLGETVMGVVEINDKSSRARVLKLSAVLESHETLPSSICPPSSGRHLRRSHAEHHSSFTLNTLRTTFALDIPSDASPAFNIDIGSSSSTLPPLPHSGRPNGGVTQPKGGLEWKVRLCLLVAVASETSYKGIQDVRFKSLTRQGPRGEWGSSWRATPLYAPLQKRDLKAEARVIRQQQEKAAREAQKSNSTSRSSLTGSIGSSVGWGRNLVNSLIFGNAGGVQGGEKVERECQDGDVLDDDRESGDSGDSDDEEANLRARIPGKRVSSFGFLGASGGVGDGDDGFDDANANGVDGDVGGDPGYDGIVADLAGGVGVGVDYGGGKDEDWTGVRLETVECEVPVRVYPGNTAFRALDVVFDV